ncbi:hypothetical protein CFB3_19320 [Clostridium folliculivorans]|uniref:Uncharacterized protein n=1 Tax=Clostridium folliculivorans TaxID=2886038 RepID=A0A9W5XZ24_9CLOT|nr:hypothetical protein CFOLD11_05350 [Clostridium folliculivorans]GKU29825.1 hypothetical protein CFB3_19320 [Clostridium folliculivorans]
MEKYTLRFTYGVKASFDFNTLLVDSGAKKVMDISKKHIINQNKFEFSIN